MTENGFSDFGVASQRDKHDVSEALDGSRMVAGRGNNLTPDGVRTAAIGPSGA